jgi:serine/threonine protein kinase
MAEPTDESGTGPLLKNRYRLGRVLGRGGMCIVYQAWDTKLERDVAVKRLEPPLNQDARTRARFDREGQALARLSHPNVVTLIDRGSTETDGYLVFEYVEGRSLKELVRENPLDVAEAGRILGQVAEGLAAAHQAGIVHRDVKPRYQGGIDNRERPLHVPRAGEKQAGGRPLGYLLARRGDVRDVGGSPSL